MLEILQYVTSGFFTFVGCTIFVAAFLMCMGWACNAVMLGIRGVRCDTPEIVNVKVK